MIALFAAIFSIICVLEAHSRGLGFVPPPSEWELGRAWWQFDFLADCGFWILVPSMHVLLIWGRFIGRDETLAVITMALSLVLTIAVVSLVAFCGARAIARLVAHRSKQ